jgi:flagellar export protein FliJ
MKKFKFTLQTVHNVREMLQEKEGLVLSQLQAEADQAAARVEHLEQMRLQAIDDYALRLHTGEQISSMEMELNSNHFASLNRLQQEAEKILAEKNYACRLQSEKVAAAMREVKVTDQLRENQKARHETEYSRQEQYSVDEMVSTRFARELNHN